MKKLSIIILVLLSILLYNCNGKLRNKSANKYTIRKVVVEEIKNVKKPIFEIVDSFKISDYNLATVWIKNDFDNNGDVVKKGSYITVLNEINLNESIDTALLFNKMDLFHRINDRAMKKEYFSDFSKILQVDSMLIFRQSVPSDHDETSEISIFYLENNTLKKLFKFHNWDKYDSKLNITKVNDSIFNLIYTSRDSYGFFHDDYLAAINKNQMTVECSSPDIQGCGFGAPLLDTLTVYLTIEEAINNKAIEDSIIINSGVYLTIDTIFWKIKVISVSINGVGAGFVQMNEIGTSIDYNRAG